MRSREELNVSFEEAKRALAAGPDVTVAWLLGEDIEKVRAVMGDVDPALFKARRANFRDRAKYAADNAGL